MVERFKPRGTIYSLKVIISTLCLLKVIQTFSHIWEEYWSFNECSTGAFGELNLPSGKICDVVQLSKQGTAKIEKEMI